MALVVRGAVRPPGHEGEDGLLVRLALTGPHPVLRIDGTVRDNIRLVVLPEELLARIVRERDALRGDLEVHLRGLRQGLLTVHLADGLADGLVSCQRFRVAGVEPQHIGGCSVGQ